ncbi:MAG: hypothetical protein NDI88_07185 [Lysobacter sp.]|nr:hypothetical protein [Lysobacter sp.]
MNTSLRIGAALAVVALAAGCATGPVPATTQAAPAAPAAASAAPAELFVVLPETGRVHAFGDTKNYFDFLAHGEVALTRTQVGAGPGGKTLVFGITSADVKANKPSRGEQVLGGAVPAATGFYGEAYKGGRFYLFGDIKDMKDFMAFGEVPYSYTDVGAGPKGETLVMVMNKDSYKKGKPADRMARFTALRAK